MPPRGPDPRGRPRGSGGKVPPGRESVRLVLDALDAGQEPAMEALKIAVRHLLQLLAVRHPGHALEVRVPPIAAVQCLEGPRHTRGTPPNVIETDPVTWVQLATGRLDWTAAVAAAAVQASGARADLADYLPIVG
jgi:uncharacterized SCP-like protein